MKSMERVFKRTRRNRKGGTAKRWSGIRARMTISYILVHMVFELLVISIAWTVFFILTSFFPFIFTDGNTLTTAQQTARLYAWEVTLQAGGDALDPRVTFQPGQPSSITLPGEDASMRLPYINPRSTPSQVTTFALLIAPNGRVLASSYPARYPVSSPAVSLLPHEAQFIRAALAGKKSGSMVEDTAQGHIVAVVQVVWSKRQKPLGVIFLQVHSQKVQPLSIWNLVLAWVGSTPGLLIIFTPFGLLFGFVTTRGLVRRIRRLAQTTTEFAAGDYERRLPALESDEIGQLELSFNQMADQLVDSMAQRQVLIEQNARHAERTRIEQELRTAQFIQQALLPKEVPALPDWHIARYYQPAREVGGDFYDFHEFADGRLGIVIGDATDKGVAAALVMATTYTMLRTAAQESVSPGEVLARVNQLLTSTIPTGMFVTCFYAVLDLTSGRLRYANAGHDWPYRRQREGVAELQATGMPLGMLPGSCYEEQEATVLPGESILLFSDGLVEAHNQQRAMFGLPQLLTLIEAHPGGPALIDYLLDELATFTGADWEQEDDVTIVMLQRML